jgi:hypothetical protein
MIGKEQSHKDSKDAAQPKYEPTAPFTPPLAGEGLELGNRYLAELLTVALVVDVYFWRGVKRRICVAVP